MTDCQSVKPPWSKETFCQRRPSPYVRLINIFAAFRLFLLHPYFDHDAFVIHLMEITCRKFRKISIIHSFKDHFLGFKMTPKPWSCLSF